MGWELYIGNSNNWQDAILDPLSVNVRLTPWVEETGETLVRQLGPWPQKSREVLHRSQHRKEMKKVAK